jgi:hypothetical protein
MRRRAFLRAGVTAGVAGSAGCIGGFELQPASEAGDETTTASGDGGDGGRVYYPDHVDEMSMLGMGSAGDYKFGLMYTVPHWFWTVTGSDVSKTPVEDEDSMHLMATVWHPETGTVLPDTGLSLELLQGGDTVSEEVIYPMLSQSMGFHYGGNFGVPGDGTYTATVSVGVTSIRRTGAFTDLFDEPASVEIEFEYSESKRNELGYESLDDYGEPGAVEPMDSKMPNSVVPPASELPGRVLGEATSGDGVFVATLLSDADRFTDGDPYLAVSARTPYNRMVLPMMALSATVERDGSEAWSGGLKRTLDPGLDYHYGAAVPGVESGDTLRLEVGTPPQVARHQGYERAFVELPPMEIAVE